LTGWIFQRETKVTITDAVVKVKRMDLRDKLSNSASAKLTELAASDLYQCRRKGTRWSLAPSARTTEFCGLCCVDRANGQFLARSAA
jgi:hypothetical protein